MARIDYYPSKEATAIIQASLGHACPLNTLGGILDAIVIEWAELSHPEQSADEC